MLYEKRRKLLVLLKLESAESASKVTSFVNSQNDTINNGALILTRREKHSSTLNQPKEAFVSEIKDYHGSQNLQYVNLGAEKFYNSLKTKPQSSPKRRKHLVSIPEKTQTAKCQKSILARNARRALKKSKIKNLPTLETGLFEMWLNVFKVQKDVSACVNYQPKSESVTLVNKRIAPVKERPPVIQSSVTSKYKLNGLYGAGCSEDFYTCLNEYPSPCVVLKGRKFLCIGLPDGVHGEACTNEVAFSLLEKVARFQCLDLLRYDIEGKVYCTTDDNT
uniref:PID domain-containing protein n=1 Tax=Loa loa TaxID=7209 RepID=A0A1I7VVY2_LOALO